MGQWFLEQVDFLSKTVSVQLLRSPDKLAEVRSLSEVGHRSRAAILAEFLDAGPPLHSDTATGLEHQQGSKEVRWTPFFNFVGSADTNKYGIWVHRSFSRDLTSEMHTL